MADDDESIAFQANAFDVVSSWLLGGRSTAAAEEEDEEREQQRQRTTSRAPVTLYRPSASAMPSLTGRNNGSAGGTANAGSSVVDGKVLTGEEKEMRKKLLRKSGSYKSTMEAEAESAIKAAQEEELDKEEQDLIKARNERSSGTASNGDKASEPATGEAASSASAPAAATAAAVDVNPKKRKLNAQEELLEKLREDAARAKVKNQKAKLRMQRKKEQERKQKELVAAAAGGAAATTAASEDAPKTLSN